MLLTKIYLYVLFSIIFCEEQIAILHKQKYKKVVPLCKSSLLENYRLKGFSDMFCLTEAKKKETALNDGVHHMLHKAAKLPTFYVRKSQSCHFLVFID